ncbi:hypothetical protein CR513_33534, partial [Mucuna pruriens]
MFEAILALLRHAEEEVLKGVFMNGLKEEVRATMLKGVFTLSRTMVSIKAVMKEWKKEGEVYYIKLGMMTLYSTGMPNDDQDEGVRMLLEEYAKLFQEVVQLSPPRSCDHAIVIKEGSQIPNIKHHHYPHNQKDAIEKFVHDLLMTGLIRLSISSYSNPLILYQPTRSFGAIAHSAGSVKEKFIEACFGWGQKKIGFQIVGYDFEIHYKREKENRIANALSQVMVVEVIFVIIKEDLSMIAEEIVGDPYLIMSNSLNFLFESIGKRNK